MNSRKKAELTNNWVDNGYQINHDKVGLKGARCECGLGGQ